MANTVSRAEVMSRAWAILRETYRYPAIPFRSIGRPCFAWALKEAWRRTKAEAERAALSASDKAARAAAIRSELAWLDMRDANLFQTNNRAVSLQAELQGLRA